MCVLYTTDAVPLQSTRRSVTNYATQHNPRECNPLLGEKSVVGTALYSQTALTNELRNDSHPRHPHAQWSNRLRACQGREGGTPRQKTA